MRKITFLLALSVIMLTSCNKKDEASYRLSVMSKTVKSSMSSFQLESAFCIVTEVELEVDDDDYRDDDDQNEIDLEGRFVVNLLTGESTPSLPVIQTLEDEYDELEIEFGEDDEDVYAFRVEGTWNDGSSDIPVVIQIDDELSFEIEDDNGIVISESLISELIVLIDLEKALSAIDFANATVQNGTIVIDKNNNQNIYSGIKSALDVELDD